MLKTVIAYQRSKKGYVNLSSNSKSASTKRCLNLLENENQHWIHWANFQKLILASLECAITVIMKL